MHAHDIILHCLFLYITHINKLLNQDNCFDFVSPNLLVFFYFSQRIFASVLL